MPKSNLITNGHWPIDHPILNLIACPRWSCVNHHINRGDYICWNVIQFASLYIIQVLCNIPLVPWWRSCNIIISFAIKFSFEETSLEQFSHVGDISKCHQVCHFVIKQRKNDYLVDCAFLLRYLNNKSVELLWFGGDMWDMFRF